MDEVDASSLRRRWTRRGEILKSGVCYRGGKPIRMSFLISLLENDPERVTVQEELRIITGLDFSTSEFADVKEWYSAHRKQFQPGGLYKYGHRQDLGPIVA
jgi:hypothetical protein